MDNKKSKILVLVEGKKTDYKLMEHLFKIYGISESHEIVSYNTNIYTLYNQMFRDDDPASVDLLQLLREYEKDAEKKKLFDQRYSDILLIFDLDPQEPQFSASKILEMVNFFRESSDMGKLYLNYPMVEAFYHMKGIPDNDYNSYLATLDEIKSGRYKSRVNRENRNHDYRKFAIDRNECNIIIRQNVEKAWLIFQIECLVNRTEKLVPEATDILKAQLRKLESDQQIFVLCTCIFYIIDYNPKLLIKV